MVRSHFAAAPLSRLFTGGSAKSRVVEGRRDARLIKWPGYDQTDAFRFHKVINEPDFLPLHIVRLLAEAAKLVRTQRGKLVATPFGKSMLSNAWQGSLPAILFHLALWHMDLGYFGRGLLGSWPQTDMALYCGRCRFRQATGSPARN